MTTRHGHGGQVERGLTRTVKSRLYQGRFGRMFRTLPTAQFNDASLVALAAKMTAGVELELTAETKIDDEENYGLPAGYTYFGQFIDHDITFDPMSSMMKQNDPDGLIDFRTPTLDLDCLYGRGFEDQPYMYDGKKFRLGDRDLTGIDRKNKPFSIKDLPRFRETALIGDKRNDENVIVSELQGLFLRFHNKLVDLDDQSANPTKQSFEQIQQRVRWHYQWLVLFDYLPRIVGPKMVKDILPHLANPAKPFAFHDQSPKLLFYKFDDYPFMPVEFSVAAYRFGHTMVRPVYRLSAMDFPVAVPRDLSAEDEDKFKNFFEKEGLNGRKEIFAAIPDDVLQELVATKTKDESQKILEAIANNGLNGFREFPDPWAIDWSLFFEADDNKLSVNNLGKARVQPAYKIDTSLVSHLGGLPEFSKRGTITPLPNEVNSLALRNLRRGLALGLPSGQSVAHYMDVDVLSDDDLIIGKATADVQKSKVEKISIADFSKEQGLGSDFSGNAPLWFYVLAEARHEWVKGIAGLKDDKDINAVPTRLGPVGGRIVAETLIGLIAGDPQSFLSRAPDWKPEFGNSKEPDVFKQFTLGDLVKFVG